LELSAIDSEEEAEGRYEDLADIYKFRRARKHKNVEQLTALMRSTSRYPAQKYYDFYWISQANICGTMACIALARLLRNVEFSNRVKNV
jgi:hypothetical protein